MAASMNMSVFLSEVLTASVLIRGSKRLWNVSLLLRYFTKSLYVSPVKRPRKWNNRCYSEKQMKPIITMQILKMAVFWDISPSSLVETDLHFWSSCHRPDDGGSKFLWNARKFLQYYTALHPREQPYSCSILPVCQCFRQA